MKLEEMLDEKIINAITAIRLGTHRLQIEDIPTCFKRHYLGTGPFPVGSRVGSVLIVANTDEKEVRVYGQRKAVSVSIENRFWEWIEEDKNA